MYLSKHIRNLEIANGTATAVDSALLSLLHLADPTLPIGGFSHSAGLETYVQQGIVKDKKTATDFITQMLSRNLFSKNVHFSHLIFNLSPLQMS